MAKFFLAESAGGADVLASLTSQTKVHPPRGQYQAGWPLRALTALLDDAVADGARILNPGGGTAAGALFYPVVVYPVTPAMRLYREEQFGPLIPIMSFEDLDAALDYVATSEHDQQVSLFARDPDLIGRMADSLVN